MPMEEPSVLDYLKSILTPWKGKKITIPSEEDQDVGVDQITDEQFLENMTEVVLEGEPVAEREAQEESGEPAFSFKVETAPTIAPAPKRIPAMPAKRYALPWRALVALILAIAAQSSLDPQQINSSSINPQIAIAFYTFSAVFLGWAIYKKEWMIVPLKDNNPEPFPLTVRKIPLIVSFPFLILAFITFGGDHFNLTNIFFWLITIVCVVAAFWVPNPRRTFGERFKKFVAFLKNPILNIHITPWAWLIFAAVLVAIFFRFYWLNRVPGEMFSDHAEKLLDISDVLNGQTSIFFPRNTGREADQMYITAAIILLFKTGVSFISLKLGTALVGILTLPYVYRLGKEIGNKWVGLLAFVLASFAYWPNVISRVGLRFPLYAFFVAPLLFYMIRGLRTSNRNDFVMAGLALGFGLQGYSPMRIVPFVVLIAIGVYFAHSQSKGKRSQTISALLILAFVSFIIFLPLFRYALENPEMFGYRAFTRLGTVERPLPGPAWQIFLSNLWNASIMFFWKNGSIWVHSIPDRPALDVISAALFFLGIVLLLVRYIRQRNWVDLFLLLSIPLLMLPSILSLAFPDENPSLNRTDAAIVPVFVVCAIALEGLLSSLYKRANSNWGRGFAMVVGLGLIGTSAIMNFNLVFHVYNDEFMAGAWNTKEMGQIIHDFANSVGTYDSAYVVPFPYWVDTRLVGINAGQPTKDYALWPENFNDTLSVTTAKLFIVKEEDKKDLDTLLGLYPQAAYWLHTNPLEGKNFYVISVPAQQGATP